MNVKKKFDFEIDEELDKYIDEYLNALNSDDICLDCYADQLSAEINNSLGYSIDLEQVKELKRYYLWGGMEKEQGHRNDDSENLITNRKE